MDTIFSVFGIIQPGIEPTTHHSQGGHSTTRLLSWLCFPKCYSFLVNIFCLLASSSIMCSGLTNTSQPLGPVAVTGTDHQGQEVDVTEAAGRPLCQSAGAAGGDGDGTQASTTRQPTVSVTHEPLWASLPPLQLVLAAAFPSQSQALIA